MLFDFEDHMQAISVTSSQVEKAKYLEEILHFCVIILEIMSLDSMLVQVSDQALCIFGSHQVV